MPSENKCRSDGLTELINELSEKLDEVMRTVECVKNEVGELKGRVSRLSKIIEELAEEVRSLSTGRSAVADELLRKRLKQKHISFLKEGVEMQ